MSKVGYIRVSAIDQNTERQEVALKELKVDKIFTEKLSGKNTNRPDLHRMLDYVREGDTLYIESISRLARSTKDLLSLVQTLQEKGVDLVSLKENIDTTTPQGRFILTIFGALSELERENILQRQREGIEIAKQNGKVLGRPIIESPKDWDKIITLWKRGEITAVESMKRLNLTKATFYRRVKQLKASEIINNG